MGTVRPREVTLSHAVRAAYAQELSVVTVKGAKPEAFPGMEAPASVAAAVLTAAVVGTPAGTVKSRGFLMFLGDF